MTETLEYHHVPGVSDVVIRLDGKVATWSNRVYQRAVRKAVCRGRPRQEQVWRRFADQGALSGDAAAELKRLYRSTAEASGLREQFDFLCSSCAVSQPSGRPHFQGAGDFARARGRGDEVAEAVSWQMLSLVHGVHRQDGEALPTDICDLLLASC